MLSVKTLLSPAMNGMKDGPNVKRYSKNSDDTNVQVLTSQDKLTCVLNSVRHSLPPIPYKFEPGCFHFTTITSLIVCQTDMDNLLK